MSNQSTPPTDSDDTEMAPGQNIYRLRVTAGPEYDTKTHQIVPVNAAKTTIIDNDLVTLAVAVRIQKYRGFPHGSPSTSSYFDHQLHKWDQYSISFSFIPKKDISGDDLLWGNDFDRPIRDRLPPGFDYAFKLAKWWVDPGLEHDARADKPWIFGPALSSWNIFRVGEKSPNGEIPDVDTFGEQVVTEGGEGSGDEGRSTQGIPPDSAARKKYFLTPINRESFTFEKGRVYQSDFGNPHLDFNDFSLNLPGGFHLNAIKYVDSKTHELRHTLKNKRTGEVLVVVLFALLFGDELKEAEDEEQAKNADETSAAQAKGSTPKQGEEADDDDVD
ncbi:hypothetical protein UCRPC4_g05191 [Phaeomoniella chlamydospora]|uniref:Domain of unknown function at the cortex 1 domain-containing protein n=1 Tax=Phaeomoniella chlamydospora TaxID=158046 RepID=A0A0G2G269_PHACM|nr:hypothetical protein UCRPC4_g05191 [Phaeomoniella chlamydospora]